MMIGPAPMIMMDEMSVLFGMVIPGQLFGRWPGAGRAQSAGVISVTRPRARGIAKQGPKDAFEGVFRSVRPYISPTIATGLICCRFALIMDQTGPPPPLQRRAR